MVATLSSFFQVFFLGCMTVAAGFALVQVYGLVTRNRHPLLAFVYMKAYFYNKLLAGPKGLAWFGFYIGVLGLGAAFAAWWFGGVDTTKFGLYIFDLSCVVAVQVISTLKVQFKDPAAIAAIEGLN